MQIIQTVILSPNKICILNLKSQNITPHYALDFKNFNTKKRALLRSFQLLKIQKSLLEVSQQIKNEFPK
jgi:hypothetical protein